MLKTNLEITEGTLLGGRVRYAQLGAGFRSGIEPVLLAATIPARCGQVVIEGGSGVGAGLLCLHARVPGIECYTASSRTPCLAAWRKPTPAANRSSAQILASGSAPDPAPGRGSCLRQSAVPPGWRHLAGRSRPAHCQTRGERYRSQRGFAPLRRRSSTSVR